jgi:hypothetical protein
MKFVTTNEKSVLALLKRDGYLTIGVGQPIPECDNYYDVIYKDYQEVVDFPRWYTSIIIHQALSGLSQEVAIIATSCDANTIVLAYIIKKRIINWFKDWHLTKDQSLMLQAIACNTPDIVNKERHHWLVMDTIAGLKELKDVNDLEYGTKIIDFLIEESFDSNIKISVLSLIK